MHQEPPHQIVALAVVIESSLAIAQEWPIPLFQYCMHLFKRINEAHEPAKLRGAFVGYGTIDTVPSPILCKRFFTESAMVFKEIYADPMHFGIGMADAGGARGMAALEGLVAALEMFDDLQKLPNTKICGSFILHIAASAPDNSVRPEWNDSELMDDMTWESFPVEFKKRNIAYNLLTLRPPQGRLAELYAAMNASTDTSPPWFELRSSYTLSAASIVSLQPAKVINKRQNEPAATEQPTETKRLRLQPVAQESPKFIPKPPAQPSSDPPQPPERNPSPQTQTQSQTQSQALPQLPPQLQGQSPPRAQPATNPPSQIPNVPVQQTSISGNPTPEEFLERFSAATEMMRKYEAAIQAAVAAGDTERAEAVRAEYEKKKPQYERLRTAVQSYRRVLAMKNSAQPANYVGVPQSPLGIGNNMPTGNANPAMPPQSVTNSEITQPPSNLQMVEMYSSTNPSINAAMPNPMPNPNITIQMQKLMEQTQVQHQSGSNAPVSGVGMQTPNTVVVPYATGGESVTGMGGMPTGPQLMARLPDPAVEWTGALKWSGQGTNGTREMQCVVTAAPALAPEKAHTATWPKTMELMPVDRFPMILLQEWIKKQQTCLCSFKALPTEADRASYTVLMQLLDSVFAVASWTVPSGTHPTRNAIFFTYHQRTTSMVAGAIFPLMGIPDTLPKAIAPQMGGVPGPSFPANMPQNMIQALKMLSPAERHQIMGQWLVRQSLLRQQQQAAQLANQQGPGISDFNPNIQHPTTNQANIASALNMMGGGGPPQGNFMMNRNPQTHGGLAGMTAGSVGGAMPLNPGVPTGGDISYETLQSLMQRNPSNGMNLGQNME